MGDQLAVPGELNPDAPMMKRQTYASPMGYVARTLVVLLITCAGLAISASTSSARSHLAEQVIRFSGNGGQTLQPFRVLQPSTMFWSNSGAVFQIFNSSASNNGTVNSQAHRGTSFVPAGRYSLQVNAIGNWSIVIRSGVERVGSPIHFAGNGGKALPPFRLSSGKTMYWTNTGSLFQTFPSGATLSGTVNSQAHRGKTYLSAGTYRLFVNAMGTWTITIR